MLCTKIYSNINQRKVSFQTCLGKFENLKNPKKKKLGGPLNWFLKKVLVASSKLKVHQLCLLFLWGSATFFGANIEPCFYSLETDAYPAVETRTIFGGYVQGF